MVRNIWCAAYARGVAGSEAPADACELAQRGLGRSHEQRGWSSVSLRDFVPRVKQAQAFTSDIGSSRNITMIMLSSVCSYGIPVSVQILEGFARFPTCWKKQLTLLFKAEVSS